MKIVIYQKTIKSLPLLSQAQPVGEKLVIQTTCPLQTNSLEKRHLALMHYGPVICTFQNQQLNRPLIQIKTCQVYKSLCKDFNFTFQCIKIFFFLQENWSKIYFSEPFLTVPISPLLLPVFSMFFIVFKACSYHCNQYFILCTKPCLYGFFVTLNPIIINSITKNVNVGSVTDLKFYLMSVQYMCISV